MYQKINPFKLYSSVCVNVSTELCNNPLLIPEHPITPKRHPFPISSRTPPSPQPLPVSVDVPVPDVSHTWSHP